MFKRTLIVISTIVVVAMLGLFVVGVAAQGPNGTPTPNNGVWGRVCQGYGVVCDALAQLFGLTTEQLQAERQSGKSLSDIGAEKGVDEQAIIDTLLAAIKESLAQAVKDGRFTQEQADAVLERWEANVQSMIDNPSACAPGAGLGAGCGGAWAGMGRGQGMGGCGLGGRVGGQAALRLASS